MAQHLLLAMVDHVNAEAGLPAQLARLEAAPSSRAALDAFVEVAVWQAFRLGPAVIAMNRLVDTDPDLRARWRSRAGRQARIDGLVDRLRRDGVLRSDLSARDAGALVHAMTLPEAILSLRDAGLTERRLTRILTAGVTRIVCEPG